MLVFLNRSYFMFASFLFSWYNHLNPDIVKKPWRPEEDKIIIEVRVTLFFVVIIELFLNSNFLLFLPINTSIGASRKGK
jgi:hypothetical protein